jgi:Ca2+-binding RTX toxin-like protein
VTRLAPLVVLTAAGLALSATGAAKTISGTAHNDTLRGTPKADKLYGKGGNDKLFGLGGNDLLVGGPGRDVISCGPGRDTVIGDKADRIAKDCEVVHGVGSPPPPPPPPFPQAPPGHYVGLSSQNEQVTFDVVAPGPVVTNFRINSVNQSCEPPGIVSLFGPLSFGTAPALVGADNAFTFAYVGPGTVGGNAAQLDIHVNGRFTGTSATGMTTFDSTFTFNGTNLACSAGTVTWNASRS